MFLEGALLCALEGLFLMTFLGAADAFELNGGSGEGGRRGS